MNQKPHQQKRNSITSISSIISSSDSGKTEFDDEFYRNYQQKPIPIHLFKDRIKIISNCDNIRENNFNMDPVGDIGILKPDRNLKLNNRSSNLRTTEENMDPNGDITFIIEEKNDRKKNTNKERNQKNKKRRNDSQLVQEEDEIKCCAFL